MMIEINDREYELKFPVNTLCMMAEDGIDVLNMETIVINVATLRDLFYYGLKHENKKITKNQAGELMDAYLDDGHVIGDLIRITIEALAKSLGRKKEDESEGEANNEANEDEGK